MNKPRSFYFHFNKPESLRCGRVQVSVHYRDTCYIVDNVDCKVPVVGRIKKTQPRFVMTGKAKMLEINNGVAVIR